jgi:cysteine desulfurase family protein (TIGR01976 family)
MAEWSASGNNSNSGGTFSAADACDALLSRTRSIVAELFGGQPDGICFGANMTTITLAFTRAVGQTLRPGDRVVGTRLDHDANVTPWRLACEAAGAELVLAPFDPATGVLDPAAVIDLVDERTRWVAVTGASNLIGTIPDLAPIVAAGHGAGARVFVDAVHLAPHRGIDVAAIGCDALVTSPYKWYGPHAGVLCAEPALLDELPVAKVRPADDKGPRRWETGTPSFESIAAVEAAARFLLDEDLDDLAATEAAVFRPLYDGLVAIEGVRVWGPPPDGARTPTIAFTVDRQDPAHVAALLATDRIATWAGNAYAVEVVDQLGLADTGVVRAGVVAYIEPDDVSRLVGAVEKIAAQ